MQQVCAGCVQWHKTHRGRNWTPERQLLQISWCCSSRWHLGNFYFSTAECVSLESLEIRCERPKPCELFRHFRNLSASRLRHKLNRIRQIPSFAHYHRDHDQSGAANPLAPIHQNSITCTHPRS